MPTATDVDQLAINTIRTLSMDAVQQANSGHPGTPMALAPVSYVLWNRFLRFDPANPDWAGRDRFVLSCGHASMLLYSMLHLSGVQRPDGSPSITLQNIKDFRQLNSPCAGHPEFGDAPGIETTTGPLGQGVGNSVGMAIAAKWLSANYCADLFGYRTFALCSDGDVMEGIGCEAASLAGHLQLDNLCWIYDDNRITIEGSTDLALTEDAATRFSGLGWHVVQVDDANDLSAIESAFEQFEANTGKPTIIILRSIIGYGSPNKADSHAAHGAPLGEDEVKLTKQAYGWPDDEKFLVPGEVLEQFQSGIGSRGTEFSASWNEQRAAFASAQPEKSQQLDQLLAGELPDDWADDIPTFEASEKGEASRKTSGTVLNAIAAKVPWMLGGSADLSPSNMTDLTFEGAGEFGPGNYAGRIMHFGVREHAMAAACNGMALSGLRPYGGTFFVFTDYFRPSLRLSCVMHQPVIYILTHDSIGLGEDGPTHQPIEHLAACRAIPRALVFRPGDANEVAESYRVAMQASDRPSLMILSRQNIPVLDRSSAGSADGTARGGYILLDSDTPQVILISTGTELSICVDAYQQLTAAGVQARVVSMPCLDLFAEQDQAYQDSVLPPAITARVVCEAGIRQCWERYLGSAGRFVGMSDFGASAPYQELYEHFGITAANVVDTAKAAIEG